MAEKFRVMFAGLEAGVDQAHATEQLAAKLKTKETGCGLVILDSFKKDVYQQAIPLGEGTSNTAEYYGLIYGLLACIELGIKKI